MKVFRDEGYPHLCSTFGEGNLRQVTFIKIHKKECKWKGEEVTCSGSQTHGPLFGRHIYKHGGIVLATSPSHRNALNGQCSKTTKAQRLPSLCREKKMPEAHFSSGLRVPTRFPACKWRQYMPLVRLPASVHYSCPRLVRSHSSPTIVSTNLWAPAPIASLFCNSLPRRLLMSYLDVATGDGKEVPAVVSFA
jgi:hypothetical protein